MILDRGVTVANGKGGVGKSSLAAGLAATAAAMGWRCLAVDLDSQANLGQDLGYAQTGLGDGGEAVFRAFAEGAPLVPVPGVREGLDVLAAGSWTDHLADDLARRVQADGPAGLGPARDALVAVGQGYDLVVVDTPPSADVLLDLGLAGSRFVCCPVRFDQGSVDGLARVDARRRVLADSHVNVDLELLGVVLFGFGVAERRMLRDTRAQIDYLLDGVAPVFPTFIREARKAARHMRAHGVVASEYFLASQEAAPWFEAPPGEEGFARNAAGLATDYWEVTREILSRLSERVTARELTPVSS
ncbi:MAG: ParA family protein [Acidimicrobiales bacterium]